MLLTPLDHGDLCRCDGRGRTPHRRPPLDLTRRNLMGGILWQPRAKMGDGQRTGTRALKAWRPAVGRPSSPVGRLCHGYCVLQFMPLRKTPPYATDERQTCCVSVWAATYCGAPLRHWWGNGERGGWCRPVLSPKFLQQGFGLLQVGRIKALGEPAVDRRQQLAGLRPAYPAAATGG